MSKKKTKTAGPIAPSHEGKRRRPYRAPRIEQIEIAPGEAMLGFCKVANAQGAFSVCGGCGAPGS